MSGSTVRTCRSACRILSYSSELGRCKIYQHFLYFCEGFLLIVELDDNKITHENGMNNQKILCMAPDTVSPSESSI